MLETRFLFQSRNRGSFDFKQNLSQAITWLQGFACFNLVIEVLLISSEGGCQGLRDAWRFNLVIEVLLISRHNRAKYDSMTSFPFQSRNRGSFDFKEIGLNELLHASSFNLVIEVLLISSTRKSL